MGTGLEQDWERIGQDGNRINRMDRMRTGWEQDGQDGNRINRMDRIDRMGSFMKFHFFSEKFATF
jgi:hypothetical protein